MKSRKRHLAASSSGKISRSAGKPIISDRRAAKSEAKKTAILDAALSQFARFGYGGASMDDIALLADVSKTNLFYHFKSKEDIYGELIRRLLNLWLAPLKHLRVEDDPIQALQAYIKSKIKFSQTHPEASRLFCLEIVQGANLLPPDSKAELCRLVDDKASVIRAWVKFGKLKDVDPHHLLYVLWSTTQHYADFAAQIKFLTGKDLNDEAFLEEATRNVQRILLGGLSANGMDVPLDTEQSLAIQPNLQNATSSL